MEYSRGRSPLSFARARARTRTRALLYTFRFERFVTTNPV
nr:MAG TPA: hypothetical protein [Caudoviricetes sp.]DAR22188.1 MAG TPA: hypothetical protein [Caudoviricetes sp.]DAX47772.1 MAG TPA: hypothetical protein [Caudoviricetes sp.]